MDQHRRKRSVKRRKPSHAAIVIVNRATGNEAIKRISNSSRTVDLVTQYHSRHPDYFVYRVNVYRKDK